MTANGLRPYPAYRESGLDWLGRAPDHWEVRRLKGLAKILNGATPASGRSEYWGGDILWMTPEDLGRLRGRDIRRSRRSITRIGYESCGTTLAPVGSTVVSTRAPIGHLAILGREGCTNQGCRLLVPENDAVVPEWAYLGLLTARSELQALGQGTTFAELSRDALGAFALPLPPLSEQRAIVRYLDRADRRIRRYIRAKERLIELLEERKRALIHEAVTGRIDVRTGQPYPAYKDSGVEWLGKVPEHWERRRLKTLLRVIDRRSGTGEETLLSLRRDHGVVVYSEHFARPPQGRTLVGYKQLAVGQLVVNRLQANNGLVFCSGVDGLVSPDYSVFDKTAPLQIKYLSDLLRTSAYRSHFRRVSTGLGTGTAGFLRLYDDVFLSTTVFLPPEHEQVSVLEYVAIQVRRIEGLIASAERGLDLLDEYRTRLIADVVTGKVDVREAAASLPETAPLAGDRDRADTIPTESNLHSTESHMAKEAMP